MLVLVSIFIFSFVFQINSMMKALQLPAVYSSKQALEVGSKLFEDKKFTEALDPLQQAYKGSVDVKSRLEAAQKMALSILAQNPNTEKLSLAIRYLNEAMDQDICKDLKAEAAYNLAVIYYKNKEVRNIAEANKLLRRVFELDLKDSSLCFLSAYMLGLKCMQQLSSDCNVYFAEKYFSIAQDQNVHSLLKHMAAAQLGFIYSVVDGNKEKAQEFLDKSASSRFGCAQEYAESIVAGHKRFFDGTEFLVLSNELAEYVGEMPDLDLGDAAAGVGL